MARSVGFFVGHPMDIVLHSNPETVVTFVCPHCPKKHATKFEGTPKQILDAYREHVYDAHSGELGDCGCCGCQHFPDFTGDCREDFERF